MNDLNMAAFTAPRSDQKNYDDLIAGPQTITITAVRANEGTKEQPISIFYQGDNGKPFKPCLSMRRVMVHVWGADAKNYIGRSMTLYGDPDVVFGGLKVGGIRISHMSHIDKAVTMALTATRAKRAPFTVQPLAVESRKAVVDILALVATFKAVTDQESFYAAEAERAKVWKELWREGKEVVKEASDNARALIASRIATDVSGEPQ